MWEEPEEHSGKGRMSQEVKQGMSHGVDEMRRASQRIRNDTEALCFFPPSPSDWGTWSCPVWFNTTFPLSLSPLKLASGIWTRWQDATSTQKCAAGSLGRVTIATARLLESLLESLLKGCVELEAGRPSHFKGACHTKTDLQGQQKRKTRKAASPVWTRLVGARWPSLLLPMNRCTFLLGALFNVSSKFNHKITPLPSCVADTTH